MEIRTSVIQMKKKGEITQTRQQDGCRQIPIPSCVDANATCMRSANWTSCLSRVQTAQPSNICESLRVTRAAFLGLKQQMEFDSTNNLSQGLLIPKKVGRGTQRESKAKARFGERVTPLWRLWVKTSPTLTLQHLLLFHLSFFFIFLVSLFPFLEIFVGISLIRF